MRTTRTYAVLQVTSRTYTEIYEAFKAAEYSHAFMDDDVIDMHGVALSRLDIVPKLTDDMLGTQAEVDRLEDALRWISAHCEDETVRDHVSRALRGKSLP